MSAAVSSLDMSRPGECVDLFYYDGETSKKQCYPTSVNTKFTQAFSNLNGGTSVFTISPNSGIQDIVLSFKVAGIATNTGLALPRGWAYALIRQISFRYGGSSQFFLSGDQVLQNALRTQTSRTSVDDILTLGGNFASSGTTPSLASDQYGSVVLRLPHTIPSGVGKSHPFPTDLLTQQVQITCELNTLATIMTVNPGGGSSAVPTGAVSAFFQVQQVVLNNAGDSLARRVDLSTNAYAFPCEFVQNVQRIPLTGTGTGSQSIVLTGFRAGECKAIHCWLTRASEQVFNSAVGVVQPFNWYLPLAVQMTYAGDVYARFDNASSPLWNIINGNKAPVVDNVLISAAAPPTAAASISQWVELPFAQTMLDEDSHYTLVHGKVISNGIVNLDITPPSAQSDWVLNVSYIYGATLLMSQGTCDYVF